MAAVGLGSGLEGHPLTSPGCSPRPFSRGAGVCVILALLLHTLYVWEVKNIFKEAKVTFLYPSFILLVSIILFFLSGECLGRGSVSRWARSYTPE